MSNNIFLRVYVNYFRSVVGAGKRAGKSDTLYIHNYGLGWRINNYPNGTKMIYHNGWWHGNDAAFIRLLADFAGIVVLGNKENHGIYHAKDLAAYLGNYASDAGEDEQEAAKPIEAAVKKQPVTKSTPRINRKKMHRK